MLVLKEIDSIAVTFNDFQCLLGDWMDADSERRKDGEHGNTWKYYT